MKKFSLLFLWNILTISVVSTREIKISTYNLWNVMFNWEVRRLRIAQMIRETASDVIAFQEVRMDEDRNQLQQLQQLLPQYKWMSFAVAHDVDLMKDVYVQDWRREGIGILSRYPIESDSVQHLSYTKGPDTNRRIVLHADISFPDLGSIHFVVVHLSYDRFQQCGNVQDILQSDKLSKSSNLVILGDFNAYPDFQGPFQLLNSRSFDRKNPCKKRVGFSRNAAPLSDAWTSAGVGGTGSTFSNMPEPGMISRPDRIFVSSQLAVTGAELVGDGRSYKAKFMYHVFWHRMGQVIHTMHDSWIGKHGRSCVQDCGPHASCRCGVCVGGKGDKDTCHLPDCEECSAMQYNYYLLAIAIAILLLIQLIFGTLQVLLTLNEQSKKNRSSTEKESGIFGSCCLCDPELYRSINVKLRRYRRNVMCKLWPLLQLPPMILVIVTVVLLFLYVMVVFYVFKEAFDDVYALIPEELYPSDHLMLSVIIRAKRV